MKLHEADNNSKKMFQASEFPEPFKSIALGFSGGGFRAASFGLGILSYLHFLRVGGRPMLHRVKYVASTSGGTIANTSYALHAGREKEARDIASQAKDFNEEKFDEDSFKKFYDHLKNGLKRDTILKASLENLDNHAIWKKGDSDKARNLINSFALAYDGPHLFNGATLADVKASHLDEICFNTTELYKGRSYRQQVKLGGNGPTPVFGNDCVYVKNPDVIAKLKLADVLAASSCFPSGFEPIIYPDAFTHDLNNPDESKKLDADDLKSALVMEPQSNDSNELDMREHKTFGFMDGGVTDNQALRSMMFADSARDEKDRFALLMVCDVGSYFMDSYVVPVKKKTNFGWLSLLNIKWITTIGFLLSLALLLLPWFADRMCITECDTLSSTWFIFLVSVICAACGLVRGLIFIAKAKLFGGASLVGDKKVSGADPLNLGNVFSPGVLKTLGNYLNKVRLGTMIQMITARVESVLILNGDVFMKRVAVLIYESFYNSPRWKFRRKSNHIYDLSSTNNINLDINFDNKWKPYLASKFPGQDIEKYRPNQKIREIADKAFHMGTTLWFDNDDVATGLLDKVIATGQFTTCYNLMEHIIVLRQYERLHNHTLTLDGSADNMNKLENDLLSHWLLFNSSNPQYMVR